jgi:Protein of unknown function (DUF726)
MAEKCEVVNGENVQRDLSSEEVTPPRTSHPQTIELDEFGLPISTFSCSPALSRSPSFQSAHSSLNDDAEADIEDNDRLDDAHIEWPRLSRSTLPGSGHVKSSPFHAPMEVVTEKGPVTYAERAKDLIKVSPVSNSVFKKRESPAPRDGFPEGDRSSPQIQTVSSADQNHKDDSTVTAEAAVPEEAMLEETTAISHLGNVPTTPTSPIKAANTIFESPEETEHNPAGASEWSHQLAVVQEQSHGHPSAPTDIDGWQTMPAYAAYDLYDDDGRLVARQFETSDDEDLAKGGAGKGYTRMNQDEDAQSADSMDENTQYLFQETLEDEGAKTPLSQMQATKELLTEGQRIAYVGLCKLTMVGMLRDVGRVRFKENRAAYESLALWSQKMMIRLFGHMDISAEGTPSLHLSNAEQIMIEQLADHGVIPTDLVPSLIINVQVANPLMSETSSISSQQSIPAMSLPPSSPPPIQHPSTLTTKSLALDLRWTILCDLFLVLIADSIYDSRSRVLLERMGEHLNLEPIDITRFERRVTEALQIQESGEQTWKEDGLIDSRAKQARNKRYMMMGLATLGGGLVIGLSAGLLAPVIGAGLGAAFTTVGITGTSSFLAGAGGAALITTGGVVTGSSIAAKGMAKRTKHVQTFEFRPLHNNQRVNLLVTVSGYFCAIRD